MSPMIRPIFRRIRNPIRRPIRHPGHGTESENPRTKKKKSKKASIK